MQSRTTRNIRISVETQFQEEYSKPMNNKFLFTYRITIENLSDNIVQLKRRYWHITDSLGHSREVEGDDVVGKQPILKPGESHRYVSWCPLPCEIGRMSGHYFMTDLDSGEEFKAYTPDFSLIAGFALN